MDELAKAATTYVETLCLQIHELEVRLAAAEKVAEYGRHLITCNYGMDDEQPCTCGFQEASRKLRALRETGGGK